MVMNFYNYRLVPAMLCRLLYEVVPDRFHVPVIFSFGRRHMPPKCKKCLGFTNHESVYINLATIASKGMCHDHGSQRARIWLEMLKTSFHEFGHIAHPNPFQDQGRYEKDLKYHERVEIPARRQADIWINTVLENNSRLYQPDFLGVIDIVLARKRNEIRKFEGDDCIDWRGLRDYRCYRTGGQLSIGDVEYWLFKGKFRGKAYRLIHAVGDDLAKVYIDSNGRHHHFWVFGDLSIIYHRILKRIAHRQIGKD